MAWAVRISGKEAKKGGTWPKIKELGPAREVDIYKTSLEIQANYGAVYRITEFLNLPTDVWKRKNLEARVDRCHLCFGCCRALPRCSVCFSSFSWCPIAKSKLPTSCCGFDDGGGVQRLPAGRPRRWCSAR